MATKTTTVRARLDPSLKSEVEKILQKLGLSHSEVIGIFYNLIKLNKGLPFEVRIPNESTAKTLRKADRGEGLLKTYETTEELFSDMDKW
jgi:DNA-damage-inducible protein J